VTAVSPPEHICIGDLEVRPFERVVLVRGREVVLTPREFEILLALSRHPRWIFSAGQLSADNSESSYSCDSVSVLVSRLRHKLSEAGAEDAVQTVRGFGYRLAVPPGPSEDAPGDGEAVRELRDASWQLQEALIEVERSGTEEQQRTASALLEQVRRDVFSALAK
jgi:DNA-binding winged helix-turn-helix (wHTH) protein